MRYLWILVGVLLAAIAIIAATLGIGAPIGAITTAPLPPPTNASPRTWEQVLSRPVPLKVTAFVTGWVEAGPEILIDATDPRTPAIYRRKIWVPSLAYLVEHPTKGRVLFDTGLKAGDCSYGTRPVYWVPCRNTKGSDTVSQLAALNLKPADLDFIVVSHFHGDHVSGLAALVQGGARRIITSSPEIEGVKSAFRALSGYEASMLDKDFEAHLIDRLLAPMPVVGQAADLFGDGSIWLIPTAGHTAGQLAALINAAPAPLLLTFDASHLKAGFDRDIIPGAYADRAAAQSSLAKLRSLAAAFPQLKVIYGHEPTQWQGRIRERLAGQESAAAPAASR